MTTTRNLCSEPSRAATERNWQDFFRLRRCLLFALGSGALVVGLCMLFHGKIGIEKSLSKLVMPIGLLWLISNGLILESWWNRSASRLGLTFGWLCFTICGTAPLGDACMRSLEQQYPAFVPGQDEALDLLVVLGGGTKDGPSRAEAGMAGDRVLYAAELYLQGHALRLITTGQAINGFNGERRGPAQQTVEIWRSLGIPEEDIETLPGYNTSQEIASLKTRLAGLEPSRVGLLTSGYHIPRAMRLAKAAGLSDLVPVAANHHSNYDSYLMMDFIPSAGAFDQLSRIQHEWMAQLIGR